MESIFHKLEYFLLHEMRMSHIYQPIMIKEILLHRGRATIDQIANALLSKDKSQVEYYSKITKEMVGKVLTKNRKLTIFENNEYKIEGANNLTEEEINSLILICNHKIEEFLDKRKDPWSHRRKSDGYVPGTIRYEVLKNAKFRCELCGISAEHKALEVDHIIPKIKGGSDDILNYQALCYSCNSTKRDRDSSDLRNISILYDKRQEGCIFCEIQKERIIAENELAYGIFDAYPVTKHHALIIPKRHFESFFDLFQPEKNSIFSLIDKIKNKILNADPTVTGFNFGVNSGVSAGQTIFHCHFHLIPRRDNDVVDPKGGVRGVIPDKQKY